jgi:hypothetical protein
LHDLPLPATLTVLPDSPSTPIDIVRCAGSQFEFASEQALQPGTLIRLDLGEMLWFAEVTSCTGSVRNFLISAHVEHTLDRSGLKDLNTALGL